MFYWACILLKTIFNIASLLFLISLNYSIPRNLVAAINCGSQTVFLFDFTNCLHSNINMGVLRTLLSVLNGRKYLWNLIRWLNAYYIKLYNLVKLKANFCEEDMLIILLNTKQSFICKYKPSKFTFCYPEWSHKITGNTQITVLANLNNIDEAIPYYLPYYLLHTFWMLFR